MLTVIHAFRKKEPYTDFKDVKFRKDTFHVVPSDFYTSFYLDFGYYSVLQLSHEQVCRLHDLYVSNWYYDKPFVSLEDYYYFLRFMFFKFIDYCKMKKVYQINSSDLYDVLCHFCNNQDLKDYFELLKELAVSD